MSAVVKTLIIVVIALAYASVYARQQLFFYPFDPDHFDPRALCNDGSRGGNILEAGMIPRNAVVHALCFSCRLLLCEGQQSGSCIHLCDQFTRRRAVLR